jgi:hypothetical protein
MMYVQLTTVKHAAKVAHVEIIAFLSLSLSCSKSNVSVSFKQLYICRYLTVTARVSLQH